MNQKEFLDLIENQDGGIFLICSAKKSNLFSTYQRCDVFEWGPSGAVRILDPRFNSIFGSSIVTNVNQLEKYKIIYSFPPYGYLIYIKLRFAGAPGTHDIESENYLLNMEDPPCAAKNFGNFIKLIIEWSEMTEYPWLNYKDPLADICKNFVDESKMPSSILEYVDSNYSDMQVYNFIKGESGARSQEYITNLIDQETLLWFTTLLPEKQ